MLRDFVNVMNFLKYPYTINPTTRFCHSKVTAKHHIFLNLLFQQQKFHEFITKLAVRLSEWSI